MDKLSIAVAAAALMLALTPPGFAADNNTSAPASSPSSNAAPAKSNATPQGSQGAGNSTGGQTTGAGDQSAQTPGASDNDVHRSIKSQANQNAPGDGQQPSNESR